MADNISWGLSAPQILTKHMKLMWSLYDDYITVLIPNSKVHGANMGPTWVLSAADGPHVGPMNLTIRDGSGQQLSSLGIDDAAAEWTCVVFNLDEF